ncbi:MAG: DMT family transporter [Candidatus Binatia bacterium]
MMSATTSARGIVCGIAAGVCFGVTAPLAKRLVAHVPPLPLASLLYLGAAVGLTIVGAALPRVRSGGGETPIQSSDRLTLVFMIVIGGLVGPVLMLVGLRHVSGVTGALLLNLEMPFTVLLAVCLFGEHLGGRALGGAGLVVAAAVWLSAGPGPLTSDLLGIAALCGACLSWAVDNNLAQRLALRDPIAVARWKTTGAGLVGAGLSTAAGYALPPGYVAAPALLVGFVGYGISIVLAIVAIRHLGAARQAALFAIAPFVGAVAAIPMLGETAGVRELGVGVLMLLGVLLLVAEDHGHAHDHDALAHDHVHVHDVHHQHRHDTEAVGEPHAHPHLHSPLRHSHAHRPDAHHRHRH